MKLFAGVRLLISALFLAVLVFGLQACGGSSGGSSTPAAPLADQDASGIYTGTGLVNTSVSITDLKAIIYNNRFLIFSESSNIVYDGTISSISGKDMTATANVYESGVQTQPGIAVTATVDTSSQITLFTLNGTGLANGVLNFTFDSAYNTGATNPRINSTGTNPLWAGSVYNLVAIQSSSNLEIFDTGSGSPNYQFQTVSKGVSCGYEGDTGIPDSTVNIYTIVEMRDTTGDFGGCTLSTSPNYTGYATVLNVGGTDDTLWYVVTNGTHSIVGVFTH